MRIKLAALALLGNFLAISAADAGIIRVLDATAADPANAANSFQVIFDDLDMNGLFSLNELVSATAPAFAGGLPLANVPTIDGISIFSGALADGVWSWGPGPFGYPSVSTSYFTYQLSTPSEVPLPAALPLFLAGAAGIGAAVRRRRKTA